MSFNRANAGYGALDALCNHYQELGLDVSILPKGSPEAIGGFLNPDMGYIKVVGKNFDLVTIRMKGSGTSSSHNVGVGGFNVNVSNKEKIPFEYHHIVKTQNVDEGALKAKLKKKTKGLLSKEIMGVSWEGGRLAAKLNSDLDLNATIMKFITSQDELKIEPDKKKNIIRIIFSRPSEGHSGFLQGYKLERNMLPQEAVDVIDKIAGLAK
jgi:hypothetical protein